MKENSKRSEKLQKREIIIRPNWSIMLQNSGTELWEGDSFVLCLNAQLWIRKLSHVRCISQGVKILETSTWLTAALFGRRSEFWAIWARDWSLQRLFSLLRFYAEMRFRFCVSEFIFEKPFLQRDGENQVSPTSAYMMLRRGDIFRLSFFRNFASEGHLMRFWFDVL